MTLTKVAAILGLFAVNAIPTLQQPAAAQIVAPEVPGNDTNTTNPTSAPSSASDPYIPLYILGVSLPCGLLLGAAIACSGQDGRLSEDNTQIAQRWLGH